MNVRKVMRWFLTDSGKKFSYYFMGAASTGVLMAHYLPHTLLLEQYQYLFHLYKKGMTVPLSEKLKKRFDKALDILEIPEKETNYYRAFHGLGFDIFHVGTNFSKYGVSVGIPANFEYDTVNDIDKSRLQVNLQKVSWETDEAKTLLNSLVLSEKAQLYAIAKEIKFSQTPKVFLDTVFGTSAVILSYFLSSSVNRKFNFYVRPRSARVILYMFVGVFQLASYFALVDLTRIYYEKKIDTQLKEQPLFAEGGQEYYTKILERNKALRVLMGEDGESLYSVMGNENYLFRTKRWPLVNRKAFFDGKSEEEVEGPQLLS